MPQKRRLLQSHHSTWQVLKHDYREPFPDRGRRLLRWVQRNNDSQEPMHWRADFHHASSEKFRHLPVPAFPPPVATYFSSSLLLAHALPHCPLGRLFGQRFLSARNGRWGPFPRDFAFRDGLDGLDS